MAYAAFSGGGYTPPPKARPVRFGGGRPDVGMGGPSVQSAIAVDQAGNPIWGTMGGGAIGNQFGWLAQAEQAGGEALDAWLRTAFDPRTGRVTVQPKTPAQAAALQGALNDWAANQAQSNQNRIRDMLTGGSAAGAAAGAGQDANAPIRDLFLKQMSGLLSKPGLTEAEIEGIINKGTEEISESERDAALRSKQLAASMGFTGGGGEMKGERELSQGYSGQRANLARDVRLEAARDRMNRIENALGIAGGFLGRQDAASQAAQDRMLNFLMNQKFQTPDLSTQISAPPTWGGGGSTGFGFGGGATARGDQYAGSALGGNRTSSPSTYAGFQFRDQVVQTPGAGAARDQGAIDQLERELQRQTGQPVAGGAAQGVPAAGAPGPGIKPPVRTPSQQGPGPWRSGYQQAPGPWAGGYQAPTQQNPLGLRTGIPSPFGVQRTGPVMPSRLY